MRPSTSSLRLEPSGLGDTSVNCSLSPSCCLASFRPLSAESLKPRSPLPPTSKTMPTFLASVVPPPPPPPPPESFPPPQAAATSASANTSAAARPTLRCLRIPAPPLESHRAAILHDGYRGRPQPVGGLSAG